MLTLILNSMLYLGWMLIIIGIVFMAFGVFALFRFPDFYTKIHAGGVIEVCSVPLCLIGLSMLQVNFTNSFKLLIIALFIFLLNPVSTYALGRASLLYKLDKKGRIK